MNLKLPIGSIVFALSLVATDAVADDIRKKISECVAQKKEAYEDRQDFSVKGQVSCPAADIVGFARVRRHNRSTNVIYNAPEGRKIVNESASSIQIRIMSTINGSHGNPVVSADGRSVSVEIRCSGGSLGQGRAVHSVEVVGATMRMPNSQKIINWTVDCARQAATD